MIWNKEVIIGSRHAIVASGEDISVRLPVFGGGLKLPYVSLWKERMDLK